MTAEVSIPSTAIVPRRPSAWADHVLVRALRNRSILAGVLILLPIVVVAVLSPWLPFPDPLTPNPSVSLDGPSAGHPFGTDKLGRDVFARAIAGVRVSLIIGFASAAVSLTLGVLFGTLAGMLGRRVDMAISAVTDVFLAFPGLLLAIAIIAAFGNGVVQLIAALGLSSMPAAVRMQRSLALGLRSRTFMDAARAANAPSWWLLGRHVLPNTASSMVVVATIYAANAILAEASLSFLGLGIVAPAPSLGNMVADGREYLRDAWWMSTLPGLVIVVLAIALHLLADGIREQVDPSLRT